MRWELGARSFQGALRGIFIIARLCSLAGSAGIKQIRRREATPVAHHPSLITHHFYNIRRREATPESHHSSPITHHFYNIRRREATPATHISYLISHICFSLSFAFHKFSYRYAAPRRPHWGRSVKDTSSGEGRAI